MAILALEDQNHVNLILNENKKNKKWFEKELAKMNFKFLDSYTNFVFIELTETKAKKITSKLLYNGIIVRQLHSYHLPHCLRISIGTLQDMKKIISIMKNFK